MNELIRDFQPSVEIKTGNEKNAICEWSFDGRNGEIIKIEAISSPMP